MKSDMNPNEEEFLQDTHEDGNYWQKELEKSFYLEMQEIDDSIKPAPADLSELTKKVDKDKAKELLLKLKERYGKKL